MTKINLSKIKKIAKIFRDIEIKIPNFAESTTFPEIGTPENYCNIINFFFATTALNFNFWNGSKNGYAYNLNEKIYDETIRGSNILYTKSTIAYNKQNDFFAPKNIENYCYHDLEKILPSQFNKKEKMARIELLKQYAKSFKYYQPSEILEGINTSLSFNPLNEFRTYLKSITGYKEDPLGKKIELLALFLVCRPEKFLKVKIDDRNWQPIIDYHWIRFALRTGMITVSEKTAEILKARKWANQKMRDSIRMATYEANKLLKDYSGKNIIELDQYVWKFMRESCEENPQCQKCSFQDACKKNTDLFQPIYKTMFY